jgi:hypothetical protein
MNYTCSRCLPTGFRCFDCEQAYLESFEEPQDIEDSAPMPYELELLTTAAAQATSVKR